jgi:hypothetical protein
MDFFIGLVEQYAVSGVSMGAIAFLIKHSADKIMKFIIEGSEDIKHERAVTIFESAFKTATRCIGYEIRVMQNDKSLHSRPEDVSYRFNAIWLNEWKEMLKTLSNATYKGKPLELYVHSALSDWNKHRDNLLIFLLKEMKGQSTPIENLEKSLSGFKHSLEYGSENWLNKGLLHQEDIAPKKPVFEETIFEEPTVKKPVAEVPRFEEKVSLYEHKQARV